MIKDRYYANLGKTLTNALICACLLFGFSSTTLQANDNGKGKGNGNGQGQDNGNGNGHGKGHNKGNGNGNGQGNATVSSINIVPTITSLTVGNGQLLASGVVSAIVNGEPVFTGFVDVPVTLTVGGQKVASPQQATCPILNLQLSPIHLNLLGLTLDTSSICVGVGANAGAGVLGNLLCTVANALNTGTNLNQVISNLVASEVQTLLLGLTAVLNGALSNLINAIATSITPAAVTPTATGGCSLLNLSLGPLNLNLLGLEVTVDNCAGGTAAVALSGQPGSGALLGNLTCGLVGSGGILTGTTLANVISQLLQLL